MKDEKENKVKTVVIVATAILVLMSMLPAMVSAQSDVRINEIMYNPSTGDDLDMEWIELYNNDVEAVNISGWTIDGKQIADKVMQPGDYVVLARNKTAFDAYYGALPCSVIDVTLGLKNDPGDTIVLSNSTGAEVDNVTYNASWGADGNGKTLERNATGGWEESLADGGTPCKLNSVTIVIPFSPWVPPMTYISNITVDIVPDNIGKNATTGLFTATEVIDNETYYVVNISKPSGYTEMYVDMDVDNKDSLMKRTVITLGPELGIDSYTFDPAIVMWDFPLMAGKNWSSTTNVTGTYVNQTLDEPIVFNFTAVVSGEVTAEEVTVPLGTFPCLVIEKNMSYEVEGVQAGKSRKYWLSPTDNGFLCPKYQSYINGNLVEELELIEAMPPTFLNATDNNTSINATTGEFLVVTFETANPGSTGYWWEVAELDEQVLRQVGDIVFVPDYVPEPGFVGGPPGKQIATFEVVGAGNASIDMVYRSPGGTVEDTFTLNVIAS